MMRLALVASVLAAVLVTAMPAAAQPLSTATESQSIAAAREHYAAGRLRQAFDAVVSAADNGSAEARHLLARIHLKPAFESFDPHEAARLLELAAEQGYAPAQHDLAELVRRGLGTERDALLAFRWHLAAAEQRFKLSELAIADMYERGEGVARNRQQASVWRDRAARRNLPTAAAASERNARTTAPAKQLKPKPEAPAGVAASKAPTSSSASHIIQLGAYSKRAAAERQRARVLEKLAQTEPNWKVNIVSVELGEGRGTVHRLRTTPMELASARFVCARLKKLLPDSGCFIVSAKQ